MNDIKQQLKETLGNINKSSSNKNQIVLKLKTLTPLYTGGIGQQGDQIHPSNLLGGIRHFSCLVARFLGEKDFETEVWGTAEESEPKAKQIALKWEWDRDTSELNNIKLTNVIEIPYVDKNNKYKKSQWRFNSAFEGNLTLQISKRDKDIKEKFWNILLISIAIQIRYAMFGSKDQFGLGVLGLVNPEIFEKLFPKLNADDFKNITNNNDISFSNCFLVRAKFSVKNKENDLLKDRMEAALKIRSNMRNSLRDLLGNKEVSTIIRHRVFGSDIKEKDKENKFASLVNISALYQLNKEDLECRIFFTADFNKIKDRYIIKEFTQKHNLNLDDFVVSKIFSNEIFKNVNNYNLKQKSIQICKIKNFDENSKKIHLLNVLAGVK